MTKEGGLLDQMEKGLMKDKRIEAMQRAAGPMTEEDLLALARKMRADRLAREKELKEINGEITRQNGETGTGRGMARENRQKDPERTLTIPKKRFPIDLILPVVVFLFGTYALSLTMPPLAILMYGGIMAAVVLFMAFFAFVWVTKKVSVPYFSAWRSGQFLRAVFSGNDVLFRPQEWGSGVVFTADGDLKSYLKRGQDLWRCGGVDICPVLDEAGVTASPKEMCALEIMHSKGIQNYSDLRKAYKEGEFKDIDEIAIPQPVIIPFARLKNYIMGVSSSSLLFSHTDYWAERKYRLRQGILGGMGGNMKWILFAGIAIAIVLFALQMGGVNIL